MNRMLRAVLALILCGCATAAQASSSATTLGLPSSNQPAPLASTTMHTSPDGGIYENPDPTQVVMVARASGDPLLQLLPSAQNVVAQLRPLGAFTYVGVRISNAGQAGSDPQLNAMQIASDFAPAAGNSGPLRQYYHPMFPLVLLAPHSSDSTCSVHLDPGQSLIAVLVYPPIQDVSSIVWGVYDDFAIRAALGGGVPRGGAGLVATRCEPPQPDATS
jgi:hypothetical protein